MTARLRRDEAHGIQIRFALRNSAAMKADWARRFAFNLATAETAA